MREWLKGIFGTDTPPPGVPTEWASELRSMLAEAYLVAGTQLTGSKLDAAVRFVLHGPAGPWVHPVPPSNTTGYTSYRSDERPEQPAFYAGLASIPGEILLRWAQVLEAMSAGSRGHFPRLHIPFPGNVHWPELVLMYGAGGNLNSWPPRTDQKIDYSTIETMLVAAGMEPHALLTGAFTTPVDASYRAGDDLKAVSYCPDFAAALDRHIETVRPLIVAGVANQRTHILSMLSRATPHVLDKLAPELAELAVSSSKQVRIAADHFVQSGGPSMTSVLRRLATEGKPEQRLHALRYLHQRGQKDQDTALCDFARTTATADKAASVRALVDEWDASATAQSTPEPKLTVDVPTIAWSEIPDESVMARLDELWHDMNNLIRADNQRSREHYERWKSQHGTPRWNLRRIDEIPAESLQQLKELMRSGRPPAKEQPPSIAWTALDAIRGVAGAPWMKPTVLFKVLHHAGHLFDRNGGLDNPAANCFNRSYASTGRPSLLELGTMISDTGRDPGMILNAYCHGRFGSLGRGWRNEDVWPFMAQNLAALERHLQGLQQVDYWFERSRLYEAIASLPTPPPGIVNALFAVALGPAKSERKQAQEALANLPNKEARIVAALSDGKSEIRAVAAQWLSKLKHRPALAALEKAVASEKHDSAKGAMLDALQALGEPVDKYLKRELLLPEAEKSLSKGLPKDLAWMPWSALPPVQWADTGAAVPPEVLKWMIAQACRANSPEPNAVLRKYCGMFEPRSRERFGQWVLEQWLAEDVRPIDADEAQKRALAQAQTTHSGMLAYPKYYQGSPHLGKTVGELSAMYLPGFLRQPRGSAVGSKGVLAVAAACAGERAAAPVARFIKEWYGTRAAQGKALVAMLAWIEHPSATQVMLAIGNRFRTKSIQEEATRQAEVLAERKGWTLSELADRTIPTAGFDEYGKLELPYGSRTFEARLLPDFKIELFNPDGKKVASLPDARQDDDEELAKTSKKTLSAAKKEIKNIVDLQTDRLYEALCTGRDWSFADWSTYLNSHPVVRHLVQRLVWTQESGGERSAFRPLADGTLTNEADDAVEVPEHARVRLAHDTLLTPAAEQAWQQHLLDYEIKPLFQQLGKGTYELPPAKANAHEITDFKGHLLEAFALRGRASKLGYQRGSAQDGGWFSVYEKRFPTLALAAAVEFTGNTLPEENRTVALLDLSFRPLSKEESHDLSQIPLNKVPKVLLSECYNDLRLLAAEGTGFDPDWEKKSAY